MSPQRVLITGGAGFLGRALVQRLVDQVDLITIYSRDEAKHHAMREHFPQCEYVLGDVRDRDRLDRVFQSFRPDVVLHLAALKYVAQSEHNVSEAISVNVEGSANVAILARRYQTSRAVAISTDKACMPTSVYGMTKLLMERLWQEASLLTSTRFNLVRYGNVLSSTGSVVTVFRDQIKKGESITITDPEMTRFWLSIDEAVDLVLLALEEPDPGTILVPVLESVSMRDLAQMCIRYYAGEEKVNVVELGPQFGEKQHEDLLSTSESVYTLSVDTQGGSAIYRLYPGTSGVKGKPRRGLNSRDAPALSEVGFRYMISAAEAVPS